MRNRVKSRKNPRSFEKRGITRMTLDTCIQKIDVPKPFIDCYKSHNKRLDCFWCLVPL